MSKTQITCLVVTLVCFIAHVFAEGDRYFIIGNVWLAAFIIIGGVKKIKNTQ